MLVLSVWNSMEIRTSLALLALFVAFSLALASFLLCGLFTGISAIVMLARISSAQPGTGIGMEMDVMTSVILGGVSFAGGGGSIEGTIAGVMIMGILNNGLLLIGVTEHMQTMIKGIVLVLALCFEPRINKARINNMSLNWK